jgi:hypothetical protein
MADSHAYIHALTERKIQDFIFSNEHADTASLALKQKTIEGAPVAWLAEQIKARKKIRKKLPLWFNTKGVVYPPTLNLEQSSSELTAKYKSDLIKTININKLADLSAGFGIDAFFLSQACTTLHHVEPDEKLIALAQHNHFLLGAKNISYHTSKAETFLAGHLHKLDFIYIDPSRRNFSGKKIFLLEDCEPDVLQIQSELLRQAKFVMIKTSPMLDIQAGLNVLQNVKSVYVISVDNECKELLFLLERDYEQDTSIHAIMLGENSTQEFSYPFKAAQPETTYSNALTYLHEPDVAIIKAVASDRLAHKFQLQKLQPNTLLYTSEVLHPDYPGRIFKVLGETKTDRKSLQKYFPTYAASISTRNYPASADELRKKTKLKEDEKFFLWAFTDLQGKKLLACERVN